MKNYLQIKDYLSQVAQDEDQQQDQHKPQFYNKTLRFKELDKFSDWNNTNIFHVCTERQLPNFIRKPLCFNKSKQEMMNVSLPKIQQKISIIYPLIAMGQDRTPKKMLQTQMRFKSVKRSVLYGDSKMKRKQIHQIYLKLPNQNPSHAKQACIIHKNERSLRNSFDEIIKSERKRKQINALRKMQLGSNIKQTANQFDSIKQLQEILKSGTFLKTKQKQENNL